MQHLQKLRTRAIFLMPDQNKSHKYCNNKSITVDAGTKQEPCCDAGTKLSHLSLCLINFLALLRGIFFSLELVSDPSPIIASACPFLCHSLLVGSRVATNCQIKVITSWVRC